MTYEATLQVETALPINMICADGTGIEKGALVKMADPMTVSLSDTDQDIVGGIVKTEKIASNGTTYVSVYRQGVFKVYISGSVSVGDPLVREGDTTNHLKSGKNLTAAQLSGTRIWGTALETGTTGQQIFMELNPTPLNGV